MQIHRIYLGQLAMADALARATVRPSPVRSGALSRARAGNSLLARRVRRWLVHAGDTNR